MRLLLLAALIGLSLAAPSTKGSRVLVCYYGSWAVYRPGAGKFDVEDIDPSLCTHIVFGFAGLGTDHKIRALDPWNELDSGKGAFKRFTALKKSNANLKAVLAIGGWNEKSKQYSIMASSAANRKIFIDSVLEFLPEFGFDGIDMDWEYPTLRGGGPDDKANLATLLKEMKPAFDAKGLFVTAAVGAGFDKIDVAYDVPVLAENLEYISLMTYDFNGCWNKYTHHNAPMYEHPLDKGSNVSDYNMKFAIEYWMKLGAPANKLTLGMPLYGRGYKLANPGEEFGVRAAANEQEPCGVAGPYTRQKGILGWNEICDKMKGGGWDLYFDEYFQGPYGIFEGDWSQKKDNWYSYDDTKSLTYKAQLANHYNLLGGMVWSLETDDFHGTCGDGVNPLMKAIIAELNGGSPDPPTPGPTTTTTRDPTASTTTTTPRPTVPPHDKCKHEGLNDDTEDCLTFYDCKLDNGKWTVVTEKCGSGTVFNPATLCCDFPYNVPGCEDYSDQ